MGFLAGLGLKGRVLGLALGSLVSAGGVTLMSCEMPSLFGGAASTFPTTQAFHLALDVDQLQEAPDAQLGMPASAEDAYAWPDRALLLTETFGEAPPDHAFAFGDVETWAWKSKDGHLRYVEPLEVGVREYFYAPGEQQPFFVRDPDHGYGFNNGVLVVVVDRGGRMLPPREMVAYARPAGRYLARGDRLYAAGRGRERWRVTPDRWARRAPVIAEGAAEWRNAAAGQENWRNYRARSPQAGAFNDERRRRQQAAQRSQEQYARQARNGGPPRQATAAAPPEPRRWADLERRDRKRRGREDVREGMREGGYADGYGNRGGAGDGGGGRSRGGRVLDFDGDGRADGRGRDRGDRRQAATDPRDPSLAVDPVRGARGQNAARERAEERRAAAERRRMERGGGDRQAANGFPQERTRADRGQSRADTGRDRDYERRQANENRRQNQAQNQARQAREQGRQRDAMEQRNRNEQADRNRRQAEQQAQRQAENQAREQQRQQQQMAQQQQQQQRQAEREAQRAQRQNRNNDDNNGGGRRRNRRDDGG